MINTFYSLGALNTPLALLSSLVIGIAFGIILELAGFGSSRRLAGIFYFKDMTVLKVMFSAVIVAMILISYSKAFGWITTENIYFLHTIFAAQIIGGIIFGIGFVTSGWCPGTGAVGMASGKIDALVFLLGALLGSILFNEIYPIISFLKEQDSGILFAYRNLGFSEVAFAFIMTLIAVCCFWGCEYIENKRNQKHSDNLFLKVFSLILIIFAFGLFAVTTDNLQEDTTATSILGGNIQRGFDHISSEELADRILSGDRSLILVDIRTPEEYEKFRIRTSKNIQMSNLHSNLSSYKNNGIIVLYSNGMTHSEQVRDNLTRQGFRNVCVLTDGLEAFIKKCLKPISLRNEILSKEQASKVNKWRKFFLMPNKLIKN